MDSNLRIAFICGCIEPGKDGIGDYTFSLAAELVKAGHYCIVISLKDRFVNEITNSARFLETTQPEYARFPITLNKNKMINQAQRIIQSWQPNLISLQYNPYSFNSKGIPLYLPSALANISYNTPIHIMFHEIWNHSSFPLSISSKLYSPIQKFIAKRLVNKLNIKCVSTSNNFYANMLQSIGISAIVNSVHSNITIAPICDSQKQLLSSSHAFPILTYQRIIVIFGNQLTLPQPNAVSDFAEQSSLCGSLNLLLVVGHHSQKSLLSIQKLSDLIGSSCNVHITGSLDSSSLSYLITLADMAITTYPFELAGKSGAVTTLLDHGKAVYFVGHNLSTKGLRKLNPSENLSIGRLKESIDTLIPIPS